MPELIAKKDFSYMTRRLRAGDRFEVSDRDAKILKAIGKAQDPRQPARVKAPPAEVATKIEEAVTPAPPSPPAPAGTVTAMTTQRAAPAKAENKPAAKRSTTRRRKPAAKK